MVSLLWWGVVCAGLVDRLLAISQRMLRSGGTAQTEETLLKPLLDER